jgi:hypothetical protein
MDRTEIKAAITRATGMAQRLPLTILGIIAEATVHPHRGGYIASWDITKRLEALCYEEVTLCYSIPKSIYDHALQQLIDEGLVEEISDLGQRYRLKMKVS